MKDDLMSNPKVSVITPSYNSSRFIEETILSTKNQTYSPIEHIVMDGGSTDGTVDILRRYEGAYDLRCWSGSDRGQSHAFNKGIHVASGEWLYFLNSDDYLLDNRSISRVMDYIMHHPGYSIYMGKTWIVDTEGHILRKMESPFTHSVYTHDILLNQEATVVHQATFYHRQVFEQVGDYSERLRYFMDYEFHLRASKYFDILTMGFPIAAFRVHAEAKSRKLDPRRCIDGFWARRTNGGQLLHKHSLYFLKGYLASSLWSRPIYNAIKRVWIFQQLADRMGWTRLGLGQ